MNNYNNKINQRSLFSQNKLDLLYWQSLANNFVIRRENYFVNLKSNLALLSNESHNLLKIVFPLNMSNIAYFPALVKSNFAMAELQFLRFYKTLQTQDKSALGLQKNIQHAFVKGK